MRTRLPAALVLLLSSIFLVTGVRAPGPIAPIAQVLDCPQQHQAGSPAPVPSKATSKSPAHSAGLALPAPAPAAAAGGQFFSRTADAAGFTPGTSQHGVLARAPPSTREI